MVIFSDRVRHFALGAALNACSTADFSPRREGSFGGVERDRTADLLVANEALSQLSYNPTSG
jgi:hypothetical protein